MHTLWPASRMGPTEISRTFHGLAQRAAWIQWRSAAEIWCFWRLFNGTRPDLEELLLLLLPLWDGERCLYFLFLFFIFLTNTQTPAAPAEKQTSSAGCFGFRWGEGEVFLGWVESQWPAGGHACVCWENHCHNCCNIPLETLKCVSV